jgi:hypothetical protein
MGDLNKFAAKIERTFSEVKWVWIEPLSGQLVG